jgi:hypothetical protein
VEPHEELLDVEGRGHWGRWLCVCGAIGIYSCFPGRASPTELTKRLQRSPCIMLRNHFCS